MAMKCKLEHQQLQYKLEASLETLSTTFKQSPTPVNRKPLDQAHAELDLYLTDTAELTLRWYRQIWYAKANKPNAMLANRLRTFTPKFTPITLRTHHNVLTSNPVGILGKFRHRLITLYLAHNQANSHDIDTFLQRLSLPALSPTHTALLNCDIQESEVLQYIKELKVGK